MRNKWLKILTLLLFVSTHATATEQHVKALDIVIDTPGGFTPSKRFNGFEQLESFATIRLSEHPQPLSALISTRLNANKSVLSSEEINISGRNGVLLKNATTLAGNTFEQWILLFGDKISSIEIIAAYPENLSKGMSPLLKKALLSSRWLRQSSEQLFQGLPFAAQQSEQLHFFKRTANSLILKDKAPYDKDKSVTPVMVISSAQSKQGIVDIVEFSKQQLEKNRMLENIRIDSEEEFKVAGIRSYRIIAEAKDRQTGVTVIFYQAIAFQEYRYLLLQGQAAHSQQAQFLPQFRQITDSVSFKPSRQNP